jgi:hypothetical protein
MLPMRLANIGSEQPINAEQMVPIVMSMASVLSAKRKRERKLLLWGTIVSSAADDGASSLSCWAEVCWFNYSYLSIVNILCKRKELWELSMAISK